LNTPQELIKEIYVLRLRYIVTIFTGLLAHISGAYAVGNESAPVAKPSESAILGAYDGLLGNAPKDETITSAGIGVQETPNNAQGYLFFSQTLANQIYYEARVWGAYNYMTQNPIFNSVPVSNIQNPMGTGFSGFLGYNFHVNELVDMTPYFRMNYFKNFQLVYEDSNGNYINSTTLAGFLGLKISFKELKYFTPYFNFWMGYQQVALVGTFQEGTNPGLTQTATVDQIVANTQIGFGFKVSKHISMIPYWQYQTAANYPDSVAMKSTANGGFGVPYQTNSIQMIGMKFSVSW